ncbi:MAG: hypothetical protein GC191_04840 [Azospirillum sp.]|nr:hypothetical protein [Azospirillum sp.]
MGDRTDLQIVESRREGGAVRQHVVATLGRAEDRIETGKLDALLRSGAKLLQTALVLSAVRDASGLAVATRRSGAPLIFERLWSVRQRSLEISCPVPSCGLYPELMERWASPLGSTS